MKLAEIVNWDEWSRCIADRWIALEPVDDHVIAHYTDIGERHTSHSTSCRVARGLLIAGDAGPDSEVVGRPWPRFADYGATRLPPITHTPGEVTEKLDGALIIAAGVEGRTIIYNRRRADTIQAARARELLAGVSVPDGTTAMFELLDPVSAVAVDWGDLSTLVLLGVCDSDSGADRTNSGWWTGDEVKSWGKMTLEDAWAFATSDRFASGEGAVISWPNWMKPGFRLKLKHPDWVARARQGRRRA